MIHTFSNWCTTSWWNFPSSSIRWLISEGSCALTLVVSFLSLCVLGLGIVASLLRVGLGFPRYPMGLSYSLWDSVSSTRFSRRLGDSVGFSILGVGFIILSVITLC